MKIEVLGSWGPSRQRVRLIRKDGRLTVEWYERRLRREKSWPDAPGNRPIAKTWAKAFAAERILPRRMDAPRVTLRQLWELYQTACWSSLADNTQRLYADAWKQWELFAGRDSVAEDVTPAMLHSFRRALELRGLGINSIGQVVKTCKLVYNWGEREELLVRNRWRLYKFKVAKRDRPQSPAEYSSEETPALLAQLDPQKRGWRGWVAITILEQQGVRQVSGLQLKWTDLDLRRRTITWPAETDKNGRVLVQPLRKATVRALRIARDHARRMEVESPYVLYSPKRGREQQCYTPQSLWAALRSAERRAGIEHQRQRAGHGFRRRVVGDLAEATGDTLLALRSVGDRDIRMAEHYRKDRDEQIAGAFKSLDRHKKKRDVAGLSQPYKTAPKRGAGRDVT